MGEIEREKTILKRRERVMREREKEREKIIILLKCVLNNYYTLKC